MWSLNNLVNKAGEALNSAKKGISEMAKDQQVEAVAEKKQPEITMAMVKKQCLKYKDEIDRQNEVIKNYKMIIEEVTSTQYDKPIDFKIVIGKEDDDELLEDLKSKCQMIEEMNSVIRDKNKEIEELKKDMKENSESFKENIEAARQSYAVLEKKMKILEEQNQSYQENFSKYKARIQKNICSCYETLKVSFIHVGLMIPGISPDQLGLEDIQEFVYTQSKYIEDFIKALNIVSSARGKKTGNLEDAKQIFIGFLMDFEERTKKIEDSNKKYEEMIIGLTKEKEELSKQVTGRDGKIKILLEAVGKYEDDIKKLEIFKENHPKLLQQLNNLQEYKENSERRIQELSSNLVKSNENFTDLSEKNANLNKRIKSLNSHITEKENTIKSLESQVSSWKSNFADLQSDYFQYKTTTEKSKHEVNELYIKKIQETQEDLTKQIADLKLQLSKALNDCKDLQIAKIQSSKYQKSIESLQEIIKNLEHQLSSNNTKIDRLTTQNETSQAILKKRKEKIAQLKQLTLRAVKELEDKNKEFEVEKEALMIKARESSMVKQEAESLLKRIETQIQASDSMIDKRIISTFLINYLNEKNNGKVKGQMLRALAEMLGLNQDQREKIGLGSDAGAGQKSGLFSHLASYISRP